MLLRFNGKRLLDLSQRLKQRHSRFITSNYGMLRHTSLPSKLLLGRHVKEALANGSPIVALESTVITHGLPEPDNLRLALDLERRISGWRSADGLTTKSSQSARKAGMTGELMKSNPSGRYNGCNREEVNEAAVANFATPATVGIIKGQLIVGLSEEQIEYLAKKRISKPIKASRRDIPLAQARRLSGGTTVAATMAIVASLPGSPIKVFATGGTGGVHVGGQDSMDISADLYEFARSPIGVVSAGFKSFLDTRRSLEVLETLGCTVMSLSSTSSSSSPFNELSVAVDRDKAELFPAFFSSTNKDGIESPCIVESISEAAQILFHCLEATPLVEKRAALLAVPIPAEFSLDELEDESLAKALESISAIDKRKDLKGCEKTPLILEQLNRQTGGKTLRANIELLANNASVGAHLAHEYCKIRASIGAILPAGGEGSSGVAGLAHDYDRPSSSYRDVNNSNMVHPERKKQRQSEGTRPSTSSPRHRLSCGALGGSGASAECATSTRHGPVVVGCTMIDMHVSTKIDDHFKSEQNQRRRSGVTYSGRPHLTVGGVGQNLARALHLLGHRPSLISALANDKLADFARADWASLDFRPTQLRILSPPPGEITSGQSSCFALVLIDSDSGQCELVVANLDTVRTIDERAVLAHQELIASAPMLVLDANIQPDALSRLFRLASASRVPVFVEPTDVLAVPNLLAAIEQTGDEQLGCLLSLTPNLVELRELVAKLGYAHTSELGPHCQLADIERAAIWLIERHLPRLTCLLVTLDTRGVLAFVKSAEPHLAEINLIHEHQSQAEPVPIRSIHFPPSRIVKRPVSASGAGDSFAAGFISGLLRDLSLGLSVDLGFRAAQLALEDPSPIPVTLAKLSPEVRMQ